MTVENNVDAFEAFFESVSTSLQADADNYKDISNAFAELKTDLERVNFFLNLPVVKEYAISDVLNLATVKKCVSEATALRNEGNALFQKKKNKQALAKYNDSVCKAPCENDTKELSLAFANRSAVLFHMKQFELCIRDIHVALEYGYPEILAYKLYDRNAKCLNKLKQFENARINFGKSKEFLDKAHLDNKKKAAWLDDLTSQIEKCNLNIKNETHETNENLSSPNETKEPHLSYGQNKQFPSLSSAVSVMEMPERGRFPYATRDIKSGDVVTIDRPFASVLLPHATATHCQECFKYVLAPLPCKHCSYAKYCSDACRDIAWNMHHCVECTFLPAISEAEIGLGHLALRTVVMAGVSDLKGFNEHANMGKGFVVGSNENGVYDNDYNAIYNLLNHSTERSPANLFRKTAIALFLAKCLEKSSFFKSDVSLENFLLAASHILRHIQMMPCNAHEVSELELDQSALVTSAKLEIGSAIYATCSLFNHSCDPNVVRHSYGDTCVVRAIQNIKKGEELRDNYGLLCAMTPKEKRQHRLLKQYFFHCNCFACVQDWSLYQDMEESLPVFKCRACLGPVCIANEKQPGMYGCVKCSLPQDISGKLEVWSESHVKYDKVMNDIQNSKPVEVKTWLSVLINHLQLMDDLVCKPYKEFNECQEAIKQCWSILGNCHATN